MRLKMPVRIPALPAAFVVAAVVAGCAGRGHEPIIDRKGVDPAQYQRDLAECRAYADEVEVGRNVGRGALAGAVIGGAIGAIVGDHHTAERIAGTGAVTGTARGAAESAAEKRAVVRNCLLGRGYRVLN